MVRRSRCWTALLALANVLVAGSIPAGAEPGSVTWMLLGGKKKAAKVAGLQLNADAAQDHSVIYRLNGLVWANGFIVTDEHWPGEHFHGRVGDLEDRGPGLGLVARYEDCPAPLQHASDALMNNLAAANYLSNVRFSEAAAAAELSRLKLVALRASLLTADPRQVPAGRVALTSVNAALQSQTTAREILVRLSLQTSNRLAIRRAEKALRASDQRIRRAFKLLSAHG